MEVQFNESSPLSPPVERCYEAMLSALGTKRFDDSFFDSVHALVDGASRIYCFEQQAQRSPTLFVSWVPTRDPAALIDRYRVLYHRVDPVRAVLPRIHGASSAAITFHADEIENDEYRATCFEKFSIRHRLSIVKRTDDRWLTLNVTRRCAPFSQEEVASISSLSRLALPLIVKSQQMQVITSGGNFSITEMERRLEALAMGFTARERQVCARTLVGMSAEGASLDLGISLASALTYRQRAYRRANVSSALQLATLVMH